MADLSARIKPKKSSTASEVPQAADLEVAEIAVNTADGKLFTKHTDNSIKEISGGTDITTESIDALSDVDTTTTAPTDGQVLTWVDANSQWEPATPSGGGSVASLDDVGDVAYATTGVTSYTWSTYEFGGEAAVTADGEWLHYSVSVVVADGDDAGTGTNAILTALPTTGTLWWSQDGGSNWTSVAYTNIQDVSGVRTIVTFDTTGIVDSSPLTLAFTDPAQAVVVDPTDGQVLTWVDANSQWEPVTPSGGASALNDLTDVSYTSGSLEPTDLDQIVFSSSDVPVGSTWKVFAATGGIGLGSQGTTGSYLDVHETDGITLKGNAGNINLAQNQGGAPTLKFWDGNGPTGNYVGFALPTISIDTTYTLPAADGTSGQVLTTDGAGVLSWSTGGGGASSLNDLSDVTYSGGALEIDGLSNIKFDSNVPVGETWRIYDNAVYGLGFAAFEDATGDGSFIFAHPTKGVEIKMEETAVFNVSGPYGSTTNTPEIRLNSGNPTDSAPTGNYFGLTLPAGYNTNQTYTVPATDGTNGQVLTTNGAGALSWTSSGGGSAVDSVNGETGNVSLTLGKLNDVLGPTTPTRSWTIVDSSAASSAMPSASGFIVAGGISIHPTSAEGDQDADLTAWIATLTTPVDITFLIDGAPMVVNVTGIVDQSASSGSNQPRFAFNGTTEGDNLSVGSTLQIQNFNTYLATGVPTDGQVLTWVNANSRWEAATPSGGGGSSTLEGLTDTNFNTTPTSIVNFTSFDGGQTTFTDPAAGATGGSIDSTLGTNAWKITATDYYGDGSKLDGFLGTDGRYDVVNMRIRSSNAMDTNNRVSLGGNRQAIGAGGGFTIYTRDTGFGFYANNAFQEIGTKPTMNADTWYEITWVLDWGSVQRTAIPAVSLWVDGAIAVNNVTPSVAYTELAGAEANNFRLIYSSTAQSNSGEKFWDDIRVFTSSTLPWGMTDATITDPAGQMDSTYVSPSLASGNALVYNATSTKWEADLLGIQDMGDFELNPSGGATYTYTSSATSTPSAGVASIWTGAFWSINVVDSNGTDWESSLYDTVLFANGINTVVIVNGSTVATTTTTSIGNRNSNRVTFTLADTSWHASLVNGDEIVFQWTGFPTDSYIALADGDMLEWVSAENKFRPTADYISLTTLKAEVAASTDFADFQSRIAAL